MEQISALSPSWDLLLAVGTEQTAQNCLQSVFSQHFLREKLLILAFPAGTLV